MDSFQLKITGGAELPEAVDFKKTLKVSGEVDIYSLEKRDSQDGTYAYVAKGKWTSPIEIVAGDKKIQSIDKKSLSKTLRGRIYLVGKDLGVPDDEIFYEIFMRKIIANAEELWEILKSR